MSNVVRTLALAPFLVLSACSSDSKSAGPADASPGTGGASSSGGAGSGGTAGKGTTTESGGGSATGGASSAGGTGEETSNAAKNASPECQTYCTCMAKNCADKAIPGGCLAACAAQTNWDLTCRKNMCTLVPVEPNNDHCTHAAGVGQCLDK